MPAAGLGEAFDQGVGFGIEENQVQVDAALSELQQIAGQFGQRRAAAHIDADGYALQALLSEELREPDQQFRGQIVHTVVAAVFEDVQRNALSRSGEAADHDEPHGR